MGRYTKSGWGSFVSGRHTMWPKPPGAKKITNREDETRVWYLAFGSNMNPDRLLRRVGKPKEINIGHLYDYELVFNKAASDGSAYANVRYSKGHCCPYVAYHLSMRQIIALDRFEGTPTQYNRFSVNLPETGLSGTTYIYIANKKMIANNRHPRLDYLNHILSGYKRFGFDTSKLLAIADCKDHKIDDERPLFRFRLTQKNSGYSVHRDRPSHLFPSY